MSTEIIIVFIGLVLEIIFLSSYLKKIIRIYSIPTGPINKLPEKGQVEVVGKVIGKGEHSPLKRTNCAFWQVEVQEATRRGNYHHKWETTYMFMSETPFEINDGTGSIQIDPAGAYIALHNDLHRVGDYWNSLPGRIKEGLEKLGVSTVELFGSERSLRVFERVIKANDEVYVLGEIDNNDNSKILKSKNGSPIIIGDFSERVVLKKLYGYLAIHIFLIAFIVIWLISS